MKLFVKEVVIDNPSVGQEIVLADGIATDTSEYYSEVISESDFYEAYTKSVCSTIVAQDDFKTKTIDTDLHTICKMKHGYNIPIQAIESKKMYIKYTNFTGYLFDFNGDSENFDFVYVSGIVKINGEISQFSLKKVDGNAIVATGKGNITQSSDVEVLIIESSFQRKATGSFNSTPILITKQ